MMYKYTAPARMVLSQGDGYIEACIHVNGDEAFIFNIRDGAPNHKHDFSGIKRLEVAANAHFIVDEFRKSGRSQAVFYGHFTTWSRTMDKHHCPLCGNLHNLRGKTNIDVVLNNDIDGEDKLVTPTTREEIVKNMNLIKCPSCGFFGSTRIFSEKTYDPETVDEDTFRKMEKM